MPLLKIKINNFFCGWGSDKMACINLKNQVDLCIIKKRLQIEMLSLNRNHVIPITDGEM